MNQVDHNLTADEAIARFDSALIKVTALDGDEQYLIAVHDGAVMLANVVENTDVHLYRCDSVAEALQLVAASLAEICDEATVREFTS